MRKLFAILCLFALALGFMAGEKRIVGARVNNQVMLLRVDIVTKIIEYTTNGTDWFQPLLAEATTSSAGLMSASDKSKLDGLGSGSGLPTLGSAGQVLMVNTSATAAEFKSIPTASSGAEVITGGLAKWSLNNVLTNPWGVSLVNDGVTFSGDSGRSGNYVGVFDGNSNNLTFDSSGFPTGASSWSVCAWIKTTSSDTGKYILTWGDDGGGTIVGPKVDSGFFKLERASGEISSGILVNDGSWHFVVATYDGTTIKTYVDGIAGGSGAFTMAVANSTIGHVGCWPYYSGYFSGSISDVRVYNRAISSDEIALIYAGEPAGNNGLMSASDKLKLDSLSVNVSITSQTASYTLVLGDAGKLVTMSNGSANTLTIPLNSSVAFPVGTWVDVSNIGAGTCTITAASGVTLNGTDGGTKDLAQWAGTRLYKIAENTWITR